jgi:4-hydroxy-tetrahydrodipicolinate reductase
MKITIGMFGFGRTGSLVVKEIIKDESCELRWVLRKSTATKGRYASHLLGYEHNEGKINSIEDIDLKTFYKDNYVDVIIDFSSSSAIEIYERAACYGTRIVSAISKYDRVHLEQLKALGRKTAVLYSPNITLGINFLIEASKVLQRIAPYADIEIIEEHFRDKKGASGTALRIAEDLGLEKRQHVNSIRVGGIVGKHEVIFGLPNQTIRIVHESLSRAAFGQGAIYAAKWLMGKDRGIYTMEEAVALNFVNNTNVLDAEEYITAVTGR